MFKRIILITSVLILLLLIYNTSLTITKQENFINRDEYIADLKQTIEDLKM